MENRLQFKHDNHLYANKKDIQNYIDAKIKDKDGYLSLFAEPIVFKYGLDEKNPKIVLAIGAFGDGTMNQYNKYFLIDTASIEEDIKNIYQAISGNTEDISDIKADIGEITEIVSGNTEDISGIKTDIREITEIVSGNTEDINDIKADIGEITEIISGITPHVIEHDIKININSPFYPMIANIWENNTIPSGTTITNVFEKLFAMTDTRLIYYKSTNDELSSIQENNILEEFDKVSYDSLHNNKLTMEVRHKNAIILIPCDKNLIDVIHDTGFIISILEDTHFYKNYILNNVTYAMYCHSTPEAPSKEMIFKFIVK